jgi:hypothetical protein
MKRAREPTQTKFMGLSQMSHSQPSAKRPKLHHAHAPPQPIDIINKIKKYDADLTKAAREICILKAQVAELKQCITHICGRVGIDIHCNNTTCSYIN